MFGTKKNYILAYNKDQQVATNSYKIQATKTLVDNNHWLSRNSSVHSMDVINK